MGEVGKRPELAVAASAVAAVHSTECAVLQPSHKQLRAVVRGRVRFTTFPGGKRADAVQPTALWPTAAVEATNIIWQQSDDGKDE